MKGVAVQKGVSAGHGLEENAARGHVGLVDRVDRVNGHVEVADAQTDHDRVAVDVVEIVAGAVGIAVDAVDETA